MTFLPDMEKLDQITDTVFSYAPSAIRSKSKKTNDMISTWSDNDLPTNKRLKMDGLTLLSQLRDESAAAAFFDPQFRGVYDKLNYGNKDATESVARVKLPRMDKKTIVKFVHEISRVLKASGHLFLWIDKFHLTDDFLNWCDGTQLNTVDLLTWDKEKVGPGDRTRSTSEFCLILQKGPRRAKGVWTSRDIPDVWRETISHERHRYNKPVKLQAKLIAAVTVPGELVIDPAAGSFSVMEACKRMNREFLGCDIRG